MILKLKFKLGEHIIIDQIVAGSEMLLTTTDRKLKQATRNASNHLRELAIVSS